MLEYFPLKRVSAQNSLRKKWLKMPARLDFKMNEEEYAEFMTRRQPNKGQQIESNDNTIYVDSEDMDGDDEEENLDTEDESTEEEWEGHDNYGYKRYLNKSYDNGVYAGYADGIQIGELDQEPNWQFKNNK